MNSEHNALAPALCANEPSVEVRLFGDPGTEAASCLLVVI